MPKTEQTPEKLKAGVGILTNQATTLQVNNPSIEILIGGPYKLSNGEAHNYGHAALRVITSTEERVYDFGRYGATKGLFGAQGEGILRVWDKFETYITGENAYGRTTTGFSYPVPNEKAVEVIRHFENITSGAIARTAKHPHQKEFKLPKDYDAIDNNCATITLSGAKIALPGIDADAARYNLGRGMSDVEKNAAKVQSFGWPPHIFMPADVQAMLENNNKIPAKKNQYLWKRQEMKKFTAFLLTSILSGISGFLISDIGVLNMTTKAAYTIKEPLLIAGEQKYYSILPEGTVLYFDRAWPEGHQTYHVYFHFKGDFKAVPADASMISPLWLRTVDPEELPKLLKDYPVTKDELVEILKARKVTKAELVQIVREWPDE